MESDSTYQEFKEIENLSVFERTWSSVVAVLAHGFTRFESKKNLKSYFGKKQLSHKLQSSCYVENEERIYRKLGCESELSSTFNGMRTIPEIFSFVADIHQDKKSIGYRDIIRETITDIGGANSKVLLELGPFKWLNYGQVYGYVCKIAGYLYNHGIYSEQRVVIFAETSADWFIMALSLMFLRATIVTLLPTFCDEYIKYCIELTDPACLFLDRKSVLRIENIVPDLSSVKHIIYSTRHVDDTRSSITNFTGIFITFKEILQFNDLEKEFLPTLEKSKPEDLAIIMFTSGSTGFPKGVMIHQKNIVASIEGGGYRYLLENKIYPAYLPLSHIFELCMECFAVSVCCRIGYCHPGTLTSSSPMLGPLSSSDFSLLQPEIMIAAPLVLERAMKNFKTKLQSLPRFKRILFQTLYNVKIKYISRGFSTKCIDVLFSNKFKTIFGGKIKHILSGGSYLPRDTHEFFNTVFCKVFQGYASTETCCGGTVCGPNYNRFYSTGSPFGCSEFKLIPWPEGGYCESGKKIKRGEIVISGNSVASGYYKDDKLTQEVFKVDPNTNKIWFHTSDIGEVLDDRTFKILGRKTEVIKLSHGEYVQLIPIEAAICSSKFVEFACVTPNVNMQFLVAILCLNLENITNLARSQNIQESNQTLDILISDPKIQQIVIHDIKSIIEKNKFLNKHHRPEHYIFVGDQWSPDSNLLTPSLKVKRYAVTQKYKDLIPM